MVAGFAQATGWPCVLAVITSWIERNGRGWKMGVWNAHSTAGNIIGSLLAAFLNFSLWNLGFNSSNGPEERLEAASLVTCKVREEGYCPTNWGCWKYWVYRSLEDIPKMVPFAFSLLFMKVVSSTFMYWLPFYLSREVAGFFVSGPNALITTAVSADLGTYGALATVTAIIDGTGSIGAALGPFLAFSSNRGMECNFELH
ncbi:MAJOR FACILITATOR SUPERFAMILY TRANSPORTER 16 ISOFORM B [Salix purpurea]|uniref:MAJOR FACILITATOR SUPERFAMILY TRANSPORTER 16 ISOFORM B n=1 Tax=Salix purpurea TaxID=77065 RepID=A0A9Q0THT6_SALPP|nr:MAJOR FACILITATOR SUPERFAMILY TRANSPORTER 16 ISOFORM B [Salix purpurea]